MNDNEKYTKAIQNLRDLNESRAIEYEIMNIASEQPKYCLFLAENNYQMGGIDDFQRFGTIEELKALAKDIDYPWAQIVEHATMKLVLYTHEGEWKEYKGE